MEPPAPVKQPKEAKNSITDRGDPNNSNEKPLKAEEKAVTKVDRRAPRAPRAPRALQRQQANGVRRSTIEQLLHNISERKEEARVITKAELEKHNKEEDAWCVVAGHVLDLTKMISGEKRHPGGKKILIKFAGQEATQQFQMFHYPRGTAVKWASKGMYVGVLEGHEKGKPKSYNTSGGFLSAISNPLASLGLTSR
mmetsp:Transcript_3044/g.4405  ORF Transcript_3044/g.4405 Transcript_3044/m.4405 type:complete len:196 (-) Transcript_3044:327-914(-)